VIIQFLKTVYSAFSVENILLWHAEFDEGLALSRAQPSSTASSEKLRLPVYLGLDN